MKRQDFNFTLPKALIAQYPLAERTMSRLLCVDGASNVVAHKQFSDLTELLAPGDLLVFNDTRVIPARLFGHKSTGGKVEILVERLLSEHTVLAQMRASKTPKVGAEILLDQQVTAIVTARQDDLFELTFQEARPVLAVLEAIGHIPLPPYIERQAQSGDQERYQTVYARHQGAVAAPTAGLHFDNDLLVKLTKQGVQTAFVTLHVGAGTFQSVRVNNLADHQMHSEVAAVSTEVCQKIQAAKAQGKRVIAVGTTSVRSLEAAARDGELKPFHGETDIFIYPGYQFQIVDGLITNFHLPESTLFMLVCAFAGFTTMQAAYQEAIEKKYRFFSYGDANFLLKGNPTCNSN